MSIPRSKGASSVSVRSERGRAARLASGALAPVLAVLLACAPLGPGAVDSAASGAALTVAETPSSAQTAGGEFISWREHRIDDEVSLFRIDGDPLVDSSWTETVLATVTVPMNSRPVDLDGDGDLDILAGSRSEARIFWLENLLEEGELAFEEHPIEVTGRTEPWQRGPRRLTGMNVEFADLNHDGRLDMVLQETPVLNVWLEQPADPVAEPWTIHPIGDTAPDNPTGLALFDIDEDGDLDLWSGAYSSRPRDRDGEDKTAASVSGRLGWFANPGDPTGEWIRHDVSRRVRGMFDEFIVLDMDQDGDSDLVATRGNSGHYDGVFWLEQVRTAEPQRAFSPARESESRHLPLPPGD